MKKILVLSLVFIFLLFGLTACDSTDLSTQHGKVTYAFNGVEKSLKNPSVKRTSASLFNKKSSASYLAEETDPISVIFEHISLDTDNDFDLSYNEPPFIQFQYLKAIYDECGDDFKFGTKYSYHLTGEIYYDFTNRSNEEKADNLVQYDFDFTILIDIDDKNVITAFVGFDITYKNNTNAMHYQKRYAELRLEYDMNNSKPTYKMLMRDLDDLTENNNADEKYVSAEYDYVDVNQNEIVSWNKFGACSKTSLTEYEQEGFVYKYTVLRALKDGKMYRAENVFDKDAKLKKAVFEGLDLVNLFSRAKTYIAKESEENKKIKTIVDKFNKIFGKDFVNHFAYTGATEDWEGKGQGNNNQDRRVDESWPSDKFEGLELDVPGFYSTTATFQDHVDFQENGAIAVTITVLNANDQDYDDYVNDLLNHGYQKNEAGYFFKQYEDSNVVVFIQKENNTIYVGIQDRNNDQSEGIKIINSPNFTVPYSYLDQEYFNDAKEVADYIVNMTNKVTRDQITLNVKVDECRKYEIDLDKEEGNVIEQYNNYLGQFASWKRFEEGIDVYYTELSDKDVLIVLDRKDLVVRITVFTFNAHSIEAALSGNNNNNNNDDNNNNNDNTDETTVEITIKVHFEVPEHHHLYFVFDGNGWQANPDYELKDDYEEGVYEKVISINKDEMIQYKIILVNDKNVYWEIYQGDSNMNRDVIGDPNNTLVDITDIVFQNYDPNASGDTGDSGSTDNSQDICAMTFKVERQVEGGHTMYIAGDFTNWEKGKLPMTKVEGEDAWTITVDLTKGSHQYKYIDNEKWSPDPNITVVVSAEGLIIDSWTNSELNAQKVEVTFTLNYALEEGRQLGICADFNNWSHKEFLTKGEDNNWTITYSLGVGVTYEFKFFINYNGAETWEAFDGNRNITINADQTTVEVVFDQK